MKKLNNKGFGLLELIIVIAIMAILMGLMTPQLLQYVDKSRQQKDESALDEILNATTIALTVDSVYKESSATGVTVVITDGSQIYASPSVLQDEILRIIPENIKFHSKKYKERGSERIEVTFLNPEEGFILTPSWDTTAE